MGIFLNLDLGFRAKISIEFQSHTRKTIEPYHQACHFRITVVVFCTKTCCEWLWKQERWALIDDGYDRSWRMYMCLFIISFNLAMGNPPVGLHLSQLPMKETLDVWLSWEVNFRERDSSIYKKILLNIRVKLRINILKKIKNFIN